MIHNEPFMDSEGCERRFLATPPTEPDVRFLWDYWDQKRGQNIGPRRKDIEPSDLARYLPQLVLVDVEDGTPCRFKYRLSGTQADGIHGHVLKGIYVDTMRPVGFADLLQSDFQQIVRTGEPHYVRLDFINTQGHSRGYNVLRMPLSEDGETVDRLMIFTNFRF